jgi:hypothetical protein
MKTLCTALTVSLAISFAFSVAEEPASQAASDQQEAQGVVARVTGRLICAHCDLGIGVECCSALKIDDAVFVLSGQANEDLFAQRLNGGTFCVVGRLSVGDDGHLHLAGVREGKLPADAKLEMAVTGRLARAGESLVLENGKHAVRVRGDGAGTLAEHVGKWLELHGDLGLDRRGRIEIQAAKAQVVEGPPKLPRGESKG